MPFLFTKVNFLLLIERCYYFQCFESFYKDRIQDLTQDFLNIEIPIQPFLTLSNCVCILKYISINDKQKSYDYLKTVNVSALTFFASFFQSDYIFEFLHEISVKKVTLLPNILKVLCTCQGENDFYSKLFLNIASNYLKCSIETIKIKLTTKQIPSNFKNIELGRYYSTSRLAKDLRSAYRADEHRFKRKNKIFCIYCDNFEFNLYDKTKIRCTPCCKRHMHESCFNNWLSLSYDYFYKCVCPNCLTQIKDGECVADALYLNYMQKRSLYYELSTILSS